MYVCVVLFGCYFFLGGGLVGIINLLILLFLIIEFMLGFWLRGCLLKFNNL